MDTFIYTQLELEELRTLISRLRYLDHSAIEEINAAVSSGSFPHHLAPFWTLSSSNPGLLDKLSLDLRVKTYSIYGFFPLVYEMVYGPEPLPDISFAGRSRGRIAIIRGQNTGLVVKPVQNQREDEIAGIAGELQVGPRQYSSLPGFLTEEFVSGCFFTELTPDKLQANSLLQMGYHLGKMLLQLHRKQIYYNDTTLSDPSGRSHLLVLDNGSGRLIDFGVSLLLDRHPRFSPEEVYNFARTLPMFHLFSGMGVGSEEMDQFLEQYRQRLARTAKEEIMARDVRFTEEGLRLASRRLGEQIIDPFRSGFREGYN